jgi:hypothetical protein
VRKPATGSALLYRKSVAKRETVELFAVADGRSSIMVGASVLRDAGRERDSGGSADLRCEGRQACEANGTTVGGERVSLAEASKGPQEGRRGNERQQRVAVSRRVFARPVCGFGGGGD